MLLIRMFTEWELSGEDFNANCALSGVDCCLSLTMALHHILWEKIPLLSNLEDKRNFKDVKNGPYALSAGDTAEC